MGIRESASIASTGLVNICGDRFCSSNQLFLSREQEAATDFLTRINNDRSFERIFNEFAMAAGKNEQNLSLLLIDIDRFKLVNDRFGHVAGDAVLVELAMLLRTAPRSFDVVFRDGGEHKEKIGEALYSL